MELGVRCLYYMVAQQTYDGLCLTTQPFLFKAFFLEGSAISFPDLCRLVAFYCISRDVLPFHLELPEAIAKASSHVQLESISHMGIEFWSSYLNNKQPTVEQLAPPGPAPTDCSAALEAPGTSLELCLHHVHNNQEVLCFINPLFLQQQQRSRSALHKRHRFKRSLRVRVSTETSCNLSPPASPPPPMLPSSGQEDLECMKKKRRRAPSLSELDSSSSFSSLEEVEDHSAAKAKPHQHTSTLKKASAAFVSLFAPEKRVAQLVEELSQDRRSAFGSLVQDFLRRQEEELKSARCPASSAMLLQGLRLFLSQAKDFLLDCGELEPPIETLVPENEKGRAGVLVSVLVLEYAKNYIVHHLLFVFLTAQGFGTKDFLPALSYVIVLCNIPELLLEVEYMMELLEPTWLTGEGGYYLTSVYASLCWIQSKPESGVPGNLTDKAQESLREWSQRRIQEAQNQKEAQQNQVSPKQCEVQAL
uniref:Si:ch211-168d1.3 n=1 Tax=Scleropages formosus TaxID=113540 RepID=A0A8C9SQD0_SCLFO